VRPAALALAAALAAVAVPALAAEPRTPAERDRLIAKCIGEYGSEHSDRCIEIIDPTAAARKARRDYFRPDLRQDELARERGCWSDPAIINPRSCSEGTPPVRRRSAP
jgi:hypothetical protein